jgi:TPR repeat protein
MHCARLFFFAFCLLQSVSYTYASQDITTTQRMAEQGDADAQNNLGVRYSQGNGVAQDNSQAYVWLSVAAANGPSKAADYRSHVVKKLSKSQLAAA